MAMQCCSPRKGMSASRQAGFQKGPDIGGLAGFAIVVGAIVLAIAVHEGPWWQKLLIAPGVLLAYVAAGVLVSLLFAGILWLYFAGGKLHRRTQLRRLLALEGARDFPAAEALAQSICESLDLGYRDALRDAPALALQLSEAASRDGRLRQHYLRVLMDHASWSREVEVALFEGREAMAATDLWRWLYWFRTNLPREDLEGADRLAPALEYALARMNDRERRSNWIDCLSRARDSAPWRRVAAAFAEDLAALDAGSGIKLTPQQRRGLDLLLGKARLR